MSYIDLRDFATCQPPWLILKGRLFGGPDPSAVLSINATESEIFQALLDVRQCDLEDEPTWRQWPEQFWPEAARRGSPYVPGVLVFCASDDLFFSSPALPSAELDLDLTDKSALGQIAQLICDHCRSRLIADFLKTTQNS